MEDNWQNFGQEFHEMEGLTIAAEVGLEQISVVMNYFVTMLDACVNRIAINEGISVLALKQELEKQLGLENVLENSADTILASSKIIKETLHKD